MTTENNTDHKSEKDVDSITGVDTTGHEWDGIKELNNPLPRWWLIIFYVSIVWSVIYWVFMPAWPGLTSHTKGLRNHSERTNVVQALDTLQTFRAENAQQLLSANSLQEIEQNPDLLQFAMASGASYFGDNCATCHGTGGRGFRGYPNLNDDVWLWGGTLDDIKQTITYGIRADHDETRMSLMPAFGEQGIMSKDEISDMVSYVQHLGGMEANSEAVSRAAPVFRTQCSSCHGMDGTGDRTQGAPDLTDAEWLFGSERESIRDTIYYARNSIMPNWDDRLDETTITALAVYVHTLGGGE